MNLDDGQLLSRFLVQKDEDAFEALVRRHGPMVTSVCQRTLGESDTEDVFQATFLVLAQHAASLRKRGSVGPWLFGVTMRVARKARATKAARRRRERHAAGHAMTRQQEGEARTGEEVHLREVRPLLDEELNVLPEKYRAPMVLCYLEGQTNEQAAATLNWTKGTLSGRLARARELLRARLARRGVLLSVGLLARLFSNEAQGIGVSTSLLNGTVKAATLVTAGQISTTGSVSMQAKILYKGAMQMMYWTKLKTAAAMVTTLMLGSAAGMMAWQAQAEEPRVGAVYEKKAGPQKSNAESGISKGDGIRQGPLVFTKADHGKTVRVRAGEAFSVRLEGDKGNAGWEGGRVADQDKLLLSFGKRSFEPKSGAAKSAIGTYVFNYRGLKTGTCPLRMSYVSPGGPVHVSRTATALLGRFNLTVEIIKADATDNGKPVFEKKGLQVYLAPVKMNFAEKETLAFTLTFRNVSKESFFLYDPSFVYDWTITFKKEGIAGWWKTYVKYKPKRAPPGVGAKLNPGESFEVPVNLDRFQYLRGGMNLRRNVPIAHLPLGKYTIEVAIKVKEYPHQKAKGPRYWSGGVETQPVAFEIAADGR